MAEEVKVVGVHRIPRRGPALVTFLGASQQGAERVLEALQARNPDCLGVLLLPGMSLELLDESQIVNLLKGFANRISPETLRAAGFVRLT